MRKQILFCMALLSVALSGCTNVNDILETEMYKKSGISEDENYKLYQTYKEQGRLDQQGYYLEEVFEADRTDTMKGIVTSNLAHITFAANNHLDVTYYSDADCTNILDEKGDYFAPGDSIYARASVNETAVSSMYVFTGFKIYKYNERQRELLETVLCDEKGLVMRIPSEYMGTELSVEPIGEYKSMEITLKDYYVGDDGKDHDVFGTWQINNRPHSGGELQIAPVSSYVISYEYDSSEFFYVSSEPECYYSNNEDGEIIFKQREPADEIESYSVELCKYITVMLPSTFGRSRKVSVNGDGYQEIDPGESKEIPNLKYGDKVIIETDEEWPELEKSRELILQEEEKTEGGYKYILTVPQKGGEFIFDPAEYSYEHGTIIFKCFGEVVTGAQYLAEGSRISYEQGEAEEGYWLAGNNHTIVVGDEDETRRQLKNIRFSPSAQISVALIQPGAGGKISYLVDGREITEDTYITTSGTEISMRFSPWEGWINNYYNEEKSYTVTEDMRQEIKIGAEDVDTAFSEDPKHMPKLTVLLDKSIEGMDISIGASNLSETEGRYEKSGWPSNKCPLIKAVEIGTETGITISMKNRAIPSGKAVKIYVERKESNSNTPDKSCYLVNDLTELLAPIPIDEENGPESSKKWYESIEITVSLVDVVEFSEPDLPVHATVTVKNEETGKVLKPGDILEKSDKVVVMIEAEGGYYVSGKDAKNDIYQDSMKISKYLEDMQNIVDEHPIEKLYQINLTEADSYGICTYKLDGEDVSGIVPAKEGQKLTLEYEITSEGYVIEGAKGIVFGIGKDDQKKSETIVVSASMDGETVDRNTFNICVIKQGE